MTQKTNQLLPDAIVAGNTRRDVWEHHITSLLGIALTRRQFALDRAAQLPADSAEALRCQGQAIAYGEMVELLRQAVREAVQQC